TEHVHSVTGCVAHDGVRRVETHRLRIEQCTRELGGIVELDPRARVHEVGEAHRVALGKTEVGEAFDLVHDVVGHLTGDAARGHAREQTVTHRGHPRP